MRRLKPRPAGSPSQSLISETFSVALVDDYRADVPWLSSVEIVELAERGSTPAEATNVKRIASDHGVHPEAPPFGERVEVPDRWIGDVGARVGQCGDDGADLRAQLSVDKQTFGIKLLLRPSYRQFDVQHFGAGSGKHMARVGLGTSSRSR